MKIPHDFYSLKLGPVPFRLMVHQRVLGLNVYTDHESSSYKSIADGRGYSAARLLRERYGFTGQLRSVGDVLFDQLFFMMRCGFNAMAMREDQDLELAVKGFETFSAPYQGDVNDTRPLYRRRG